MNSIQAPVVRIDLDRPRLLKYDFNAFAELEEATGVNFLDGGVTSPSVTILRAMVWAGLIHEDPGLTQKQVGAMLHKGNVEYVFGRVSEAMATANGDKPEGQPETPTTAAAIQ